MTTASPAVGASPPSPPHRADRATIQSIAALVAVSLVLLAGIALRTAEESNELATGRQSRLAAAALEAAEARLKPDLRPVAVSDEGYRRIHLRFDPDYTAAIVATPLFEDFGHDVTMVFGPSRQMQFVWMGGHRVTDDRAEATATAVLDLVDAVRTRMRDLEARYPAAKPVPERAIGRSPAARAALERESLEPDPLAGRIVAETGLIDAAGHAAVAVAAAVLPEHTAGLRRPGPPTVIVGLRYVGDRLLTDITRTAMLQELRYVPAEAGRSDAGSASLPLATTGGRVLGHLVWTPTDPGSQMLQHLGPVLTVAGALFVAFAIVVIRQFRSAAREIAESEARAKWSSLHDALSGIANRVLLAEQLNEAVAELVTRPERPLAIVYVDLDRFKDINDTLGHHAGDMVIRETANRLTEVARPGDTPARISGDEFALIIRSAPDRGEIEARLNLLVQALGRPIPYGERTIFPGASVGCVIAPEHGRTVEELVGRADIALYAAKHGGRGRFVVYSPELDEAPRRRQLLRQDLRAALAENRLSLAYQPVFTLGDMRPVCIEARVAWEHPTRGRIAAGEFIPVAEECGLIRELGAWVLRTAAREARNWPDLRLAVNVSPLELRNPAFATDMLNILAEEAFDPRRLQIELTENILIADADQALQVMTALRNAGVRVALDEFGSGQSSFNYLARFRFDVVKIDSRIVEGVETSKDIATIVETMVDLARKLGLETSAEGVETFGQFRFVEACGCDTVQGHLCARPMPGPDLVTFLAKPRQERIRAVG